MKKLTNTLLFVLLITISVNLNAQNKIPAFKENDKIAFVGNSITHGGHYHSYIWLYYMTHFPEMPVTIYNCGIGGDCSWDILERIREDVLSKEPDYITLTFGMNDVGYYEFYWDDAEKLAREKVERAHGAYKNIEKILKNETDANIVLIGSSPYDEGSRIENQIFPGKNDAIKKIVEFQEQAAQENNWGFVDFNEPMSAINRTYQETDSLFTLCGGDRIHPDNDGHMVMAYLILKAQGLDGQKVSEVVLNAKKAEIEVSDNCKITNLKSSKNHVEYDYLARSLPYPLDTLTRGWGSKHTQAEGSNFVPFIEEFNQELIKINKLEEGNYKLLIDGKYIAEFSSVELSEGINLALYNNTPQYMQAEKIMLLNEERFELEKRFRDYAWMQYSFLQGKGVLNASQDVISDTLNVYLPKDAFVRGNYDVYSKARYPEMRSVWENTLEGYVAAIYTINKPEEHHIKIVKAE